MILLRLISWPYFRRHVLRSLLTTSGIVLGVAVYVGMNTANRSVLSALSTTVDRIAGKTELQIVAGGTGFAEDVLETVQSAESVSVAVPVIEAVVDTNIRGEGSLLILGVDLTGDRTLRNYDLEGGEEAVIDDPLVFLAQPDSVIVASEFANANQLTTGSQITLGTGIGDKRFTVRGIMKSGGGLTSAFGGSIAIMDIYAAQKMFNRGRTFDRIDLAVKPGHTLDECRHELQSRIGPGFQIEAPATRGQHFGDILAGYSLMMRIASLFALFVGMFIIYNSFAIAVTERRSEIGILRALGATRGQIRWLFLGESALTGVIGSLIGLFAGVLMARAMSATVGTLVNDVYGIAQGPADLVASPRLMAYAFGIGIITSLVAALVPARAAAAADPVQALRKGTYQILSVREHRVRSTLAVLLAAAAVALQLLGNSRWTFYTSHALAVTVALLLTPALSLRLARLFRPVLQRLWPVEGSLAADSLAQSPRRTAAVVAALMLSLAMVMSFGGIARASRGSIVAWVESELDPDLWVMASRDIGTRTIRFPPSMKPELAEIAGIERVQMLREDRIVFRQTPVMMLALDLSDGIDRTRLSVADGNLTDMLRQMAAGEAILVSDILAQLQNLKRGDIVELPAPAGVLRLPIAGIIVDYSDQLGIVMMERRVFERYWRDDSVNFFRIYLNEGALVPDVKRRILERYAGERQVFVLNNDELKRYILRATDQWFGLTYVQVAVAVLIAMFGIVNTLTVSIADRRRELGILRAVGGQRKQIRRTIRIEAVTIGVIGIILGLGLGAINLHYVLEVVRRDIMGMRLPYQFPAGVALAVMPMVLVAAFLAALWPAEVAVHGSLVEALEYE